MKFVLDYFNIMTAGRTHGVRILGRSGVIKVNTYHRFIQGFIPQYASLAAESADADFREKISPPYSLVRAPGLKSVQSLPGEYPTLMLANEGPDLSKVIYSTDLWHFYCDDASHTDLGIPDGTPASNVGIDAVIFNSNILTSHPLDGSLYYAPIEASPSWQSISASSAAVVKILHVIEDQCLMLDSSLGTGKPRDLVRIVTTDFSVTDGFAVGTSDYDLQDIADYQGRFALLFALKTTSGGSSPLLSAATTVFLWDVVPGDSYDLKLILPGIYQCSIVKNGVVFAFTQLGTTLICYEFTGADFREVGRIKNVVVNKRLAVPKTRIGIEGDFFVILASSPGNTDSVAPLYWNPSTAEAFFLVANIDGQPFLSLLTALDFSAGVSVRYLSYQNTDETFGTLYKCGLEGDAGNDFLSDSYDPSNRDGFGALPDGSLTTKDGQSFTAKGGLLSKATFYLAKNGSPTGNMTCSLYAHSGTFGTGVPTGSPIATSNPVDAATLTGDYDPIAFTFPDQPQLAAGQHYFVAVEFTGGGGSDYVEVALDGSAPSHDGNQAIFHDSAWHATTDVAPFQIMEIMPSEASYKSNQIPAPQSGGIDGNGDLGRIQINHIELEFNKAPPTESDSIAFTLTTKDEYESETYTDQTATVKDTSAHSTNASVDSKRAIIPLGANATELAIDLDALIATPSWDLVIRRVIVDYDPIAPQR